MKRGVYNAKMGDLGGLSRASRRGPHPKGWQTPRGVNLPSVDPYIYYIIYTYIYIKEQHLESKAGVP
mgnify:CR=1 FL=1